MEAAKVAPGAILMVTVTVPGGCPGEERYLAPMRVKVPSRCNMCGA